MLSSPPRVIPLVALALAGLCQPTLADFMTIGPVNIKGNSFAESGGITPPDTDGSVGLNHYVQFTNGTYAIYNKSDGSLVTPKISDATFWTNAGISPSTISSGLSDTRIIFDQQSQRWFATEITVQATDNTILVAVSKTADPTSGFKAVAITNAPTTGEFADFPTVGINHDSVIIGTNNFNAAGTAFLGSQAFNIPKADLLLPTPSIANLTKTADLNDRGFTFQGVNDFSGQANHALILSSDSPLGSTSSSIYLSKFNNPTTSSAALGSPTFLPVAPYQESASYAHQRGNGGVIDDGDARFSSAVYDVNGKIYAAHSVNSTNGSNLSAIQWFVLNDQTGAVISQGIYQSLTLDYYYPSITANANGDVVMGFTESGTSMFTSTAAVLGTTDANGNVTFGTTLVTHAGAVTYAGVGDGQPRRWGDYSSITADPTNSNIFWTSQEYADGRNSWTTQVTELIVTPTAVPEPSSIALCVIGLAGGAMFARRRKATATA